MLTFSSGVALPLKRRVAPVGEEGMVLHLVVILCSGEAHALWESESSDWGCCETLPVWFRSLIAGVAYM